MIYRLLKLISPSSARFLREAAFTLNGWRFADLKESIRTQMHPLSLQERLPLFLDGLLTAERAPDCNGFALITPTPPMNTGVANCNLRTLAEGGMQCDIISAWESTFEYGEFLRFSKSLALNNFAYHSDLFEINSIRRGYNTVVASVGNSDHNLFALNLLGRSTGRTFELVIHLHDPCLWNIAFKVCESNGVNFIDAVNSAYPEVGAARIDAALKNAVSHWQRISALVDLGLYGTKIVLDFVRPDRVVVNSSRGLEMIEAEYEGASRNFDLQLGFHPVFSSDRRKVAPHATQDGAVRVGTFGIPSRSKATRTVIEACKLLRKRGLPVKLVIAGYGAAEFMAREGIEADPDQLEIHSNVSNEDLLDLMDGVDLAVQLRDTNLGECSGVISSLSAKYCPTIVTDLGSFSEYGEFATLVPRNCGAEDLAQTMANAMSEANGDDKYVRYVGEHHARRLCDILFGR